MSQQPFLLSAEGLNKNFAGFQAITDLSFYLDEGELRTLRGELSGELFADAAGRAGDDDTLASQLHGGTPCGQPCANPTD